ncbi:MAG: pyrroline-5-carboxylate reductase family protein, partial [Alphaproteobacteria bacterium]
MILENITSLALVGAGKMGGALLEGWLANGLEPGAVTIVDPTPGPQVAALVAQHRLKLAPKGGDLAGCQVVVLAVKPQIMGQVLAGLTAPPACVFLSIAAGQTLADIENGLGQAGQESAVVRAMPNTPASVGAGISVLVANARASAPTREMCTGLMAAVGAVEWVEDETLLDPVTAVSGSGPAYVFHLVEALAQAGVGAGLPPKLALRLARKTVV